MAKRRTSKRPAKRKTAALPKSVRNTRRMIRGVVGATRWTLGFLNESAGGYIEFGRRRLKECKELWEGVQSRATR